MFKNIAKVYENITVKLDDNEFLRCKFLNCRLEYSGSGRMSMVECSFVNTQWAFTGPAKNTLQFMRAVYHGTGGGGKKMIERTFEMIKEPPKETKK